MAETEIRFERVGHAGKITLCRPKALNALSMAMVEAMDGQLRAWREDPGVRHVVIRGEGRAFCAGGDIRAVYEEGRAGPSPKAFLGKEYRLNAAIRHFPKPFVALVHGYVMGGGAGISIHGSHRLFSEDAIFSMPETAIGFFPDVGLSFVLSRLPHEIGLYLGLAAARIARGDAFHLGLATHAVAGADFDAIEAALAEATDVDAAIAPFLISPGHPLKPETLGRLDGTIDQIFATGDLDTILRRLDRVEGVDAPWADRTAAAIRAKSPTSLRITLRQLRAAKALEFDDCIRLDWRIAREILNGHDFYEGVRAALVDKDGAPRWRPDTIKAVDARAVDGHFVMPADGDLPLP